MLVLIVLTFTGELTAQNPSIRKITFDNNGLKMAGNLYLPVGFDENKKYSAIISVHPGGGVKEQTSGLYAQKMAEQGYVALAFD
ncbi:MAG: alpha/beta hydrolase, partial [Bacteroidota bacterium]